MPNFKKSTSPFMMKGFSGFGNSPLKNKNKNKKLSRITNLIGNYDDKMDALSNQLHNNEITKDNYNARTKELKAQFASYRRQLEKLK
tara:strand:+ start:47 stop:307 length:261 start_codon:yes stop_codon:yes gene_type:complete